MKWEPLNGDESGVLIADRTGARWLLRSKRKIGRFVWEAVADHAVTGRLRVVDDTEYHTRREAEAAAEAAITGLGFQLLPWNFNEYLDFLQTDTNPTPCRIVWQGFSLAIEIGGTTNDLRRLQRPNRAGLRPAGWMADGGRQNYLPCLLRG